MTAKPKENIVTSRGRNMGEGYNDVTYRENWKVMAFSFEQGYHNGSAEKKKAAGSPSAER